MQRLMSNNVLQGGGQQLDKAGDVDDDMQDNSEALHKSKE